MRMHVCYLHFFLNKCIYKKGLGNAHPTFCSTLPRLSWSWTLLLPSDTDRKYITSITAVLLPFVTYLLTLPRTRKARRRIVRRKLGVWSLKGARENTEQGICPTCSLDEDWSHAERCGDKILDKGFQNIDAEIGNWRKAGCKNVAILWSVTIDGVWIGNWIYWTLTDHNYK
jgi:hypothetical protein